MALFQTSVVNKYLSSLNSSLLQQAFQKFKQFYGDKERIENIKQLKEENYQEGFLREIFVDVLGYTINPNVDYNLTTEFKNETDSKKADGAILSNSSAIGVIELKSTKTTNLESITNQAFNYKNHQPNCRYVITSNFERLRFYIDNATEYEEFDLFNLTEKDFAKLYLLLSKDSIFSNIPSKLKEESKLHEENISDQLYKDYKEFKDQIFTSLVEKNPDYNKLLLFEKSQKLLDRILFILFAEDRGLIPPNAITKIVEQWKQLKDLDEEKSLYSRFIKFFSHLNTGHKYKDFELPPYNGGLFKPDDVLDKVKIDDEILHKGSLNLSTYDFNTEVDVNILGHIFEHSLSEIEEVTAELEGTQTDKTKSRRKKEGVYYTPKYITKYIVDNTIGTLCKEKREELGLVNIDEEIFNNSRTVKGELNKKAKTLFENFKLYTEYLLSLKILDPACGSGAFLNQALEFLIKEHNWIAEQVALLLGQSLVIPDVGSDILENNLYGVDINEEAVEIAKLSLWLRTAQKGRKLSDLSQNIKCGNSLIDDPAVAGDKAFDWKKEFPEIMSNGGFDVVIGNPPYVMLSPEFFKNYSLVSGNNNTYVAFIEKSIELKKDIGKLGLIIPTTWFGGDNFIKLRNFLIDNYFIENLIQLPYDIFPAYIDTTIIILSSKLKENITNIFQFDINASKEEINDFKFNKINQKEWKNYNKIFLNTELLKIGQKVWFSKNNIKLGDIASINRGTLPPKENEKSLINDNHYNLKWFDDQIFRYKIEKYTSFDSYVNQESLKENKPLELFQSIKILARQLMSRQFRMNLTYIEDQFAFKKNLYAIYKLSDKFDYKYLLAVLNSKLFSFCQFNFNSSLQRDDFPAFSLNDFREFNIPQIEEQQSFIYKAEIMLKVNEELNVLIKTFFNRIISNLDLNKFSTKLEQFYNHDFKTFLKELNKQKVKLSLKQQDEWYKYFEEYKTKINELQQEITKTDNEIDIMVYKLYNLTYEEAQIVDPGIDKIISKEEFEKQKN